MIEHLELIKGVHPGLILDRELKLRRLSKSNLAKLLGEHPQTIVAIIKGKRKMNTALALKIEALFDLEEGLLMVLQVYYDIEQEKKKQPSRVPEIAKLRTALFWDTSMGSINWEKQKNAVIKRVYERGNDAEKAEINRFYGQDQVNEVLTTYGNKTSL